MLIPSGDPPVQKGPLFLPVRFEHPTRLWRASEPDLASDVPIQQLEEFG
jgi:hypothetical protein